jgi:5-methylcytosine-specific restriction endonuclease McrA
MCQSSTIDRPDFINNNIERRCSRCKKIKVLDGNFVIRNKKSSHISKKYAYYCNKCHYQYSLEKKYKVKHLKLIKDFICNYLDGKSCLHCGETNMVLFEFDHLNQSEKFEKIAYMVASGYSIDSLKHEISKCQILCGNCHRLKTATQLGYYSYLNEDNRKLKNGNITPLTKVQQKYQITIENLKNSNGCIDCGLKNHLLLEFDHIDPNEKHGTISAMASDYTISLNDIKNEIAKCEIRCCNCHRMKTAKDRKYYRYKWIMKNKK